MDQTEIAFVGDLDVDLWYEAPGSKVTETRKEQKKLANPTKGCLHVTILQVKNLKNVTHENGGVDAFCKL